MDIHLHIANLHIDVQKPTDTEALARLIKSEFKGLKELMMGQFDDIEAKIQTMSDATTKVGQELQSLRDQIANGLTPEQGATLAAQLDEHIAALTAMSPSDPSGGVDV